MTEKWQSTDLSTILPELVDSARRLKGSLEEGQINVEQCIAILESMERSIDDLKSTFSISDERPSGKGAPNVSLDPKILGKGARDTLWDALPRGADLREIYIEHSKYFLLHKLHNANYENDPVVIEVFGKAGRCDGTVHDGSLNVFELNTQREPPSQKNLDRDPRRLDQKKKEILVPLEHLPDTVYKILFSPRYRITSRKTFFFSGKLTRPADQGDINSHGSSLGWVPAENGKMRPEEIAVHTIEFQASGDPPIRPLLLF
ncbi:hypothetical protein B0H16DRAFT_1475275 [Mycena metata]|uniref:Uncharacterized protein n=1 Tax=Mycena metata TaxID=1033252 RepID=A0AAD7MIC3_9AGAR|nr:hypothetical protein B0H16DRAFT_1475275 [Mycena metata]